ncbi:MAG: hypothetical protein ACR2OZ_07725 [Verrucomicrobiales bacterium]
MNTIPTALRAAALRETLRERFPAAHSGAVPRCAFATGVPCLDCFSIPQGSFTEIVNDSLLAGSGVLLAAVLDKARQEKRLIGLIDAANAFDPQSHHASTRLLWVRCRQIEDALRAADLLLRDGNLPFVVLDFQLCARQILQRVPASSWTRLGLLAEKSGVTSLAFTPCTTLSCASVRLRMEAVLGPEISHLSRSEITARLRLHLDRTRTGIMSPPFAPPLEPPLPAAAFSILDGTSAPNGHSIIHALPLRKAG